MWNEPSIWNTLESVAEWTRFGEAKAAAALAADAVVIAALMQVVFNGTTQPTWRTSGIDVMVVPPNCSPPTVTTLRALPTG